MSKAERTKAFIIEKVSRTFNTKGYWGTSLNDITEATGLTKGAIYGNFENKEAIAIAVYKYNVAGLGKRLAEKIDGEKTAYGKLIAFTQYYREGWKNTFSRGGCPIQNASIEADDNLEFLKPYVQNSLKSWAADISGMIEEGKKTKEFKTSIDAKEYAYLIITILEGGIMLSKIMNDPKQLFASIDRIVQIVNQELKR